MTNASDAVLRLLEVMRRLRAPDGCPWDKEQTLKSLRPYLIEECYEVLEEMDRVSQGATWDALCGELGDLLFQIVFHAQLAEERGEFNFADVCTAVAEKLERRHPHVFGEERVQGAEQVLQNWAKLKMQERQAAGQLVSSALDGVPRDAPALLSAERLGEKAARVGFDWKDIQGPRAKVAEELAELDDAIARGDTAAIEHELGDVLFSLTNLARWLKTPAEDALRGASARFARRFRAVEAGLRERAVEFGAASPELLDQLWVRAKAEE